MDSSLLLNIKKFIQCSKDKIWVYKQGGYYKQGYMDAVDNIEKIIDNYTLNKNKNHLSKQHDNLMALLDSVDGVKEHMNSYNVIKGEEVLRLRLERLLTLEDVSELSGVDTETLKNIEVGDKIVAEWVYDKVLHGLNKSHFMTGAYIFTHDDEYSEFEEYIANPHKELITGDVGLESIWSMSDDEYWSKYPIANRNRDDKDSVD